MIAQVCPAGPATAEPCTARVAVAEVTDAHELTVDPPAGSRRVRLAGIEVPRPRQASARADGALPRRALPEQALPERARGLLAEIAGGRSVCLAAPGLPADRYGRLLAQVSTEDGRWLQGELLRYGLARVQTMPEAAWRAAEMLALEAEARAARRGLWREPEFQLRPASAVDGLLGSFQIVEGTPQRVARRGDRWYLDFGADWRTDFSVSLPVDALGGATPLAWAGRPLRVRGWVESSFGPRIEVTHPEQIELLDGGASPAGG